MKKLLLSIPCSLRHARIEKNYRYFTTSFSSPFPENEAAHLRIDPILTDSTVQPSVDSPPSTSHVLSPSSIKAFPSAPFITPNQRIALIGIHGWYPLDLFSKFVGPMTPSSHFVENMYHALLESQCFSVEGEEEDTSRVLKIALEGQGKIQDRVENFYKLIMQCYKTPLSMVDEIYLVAHSQGVPVSILLLDKLVSSDLFKDRQRCVGDPLNGPRRPLRIVVLTLAGIYHGPMPFLGENYYIQWIEREASRELFLLNKKYQASLSKVASSNSNTPVDDITALNASGDSKALFSYMEDKTKEILQLAISKLKEQRLFSSNNSQNYSVGTLVQDTFQKLLSAGSCSESGIFIKIVSVASWKDPVVPLYSSLFHGVKGTHESGRLSRYILSDEKEAQEFPVFLVALLLNRLNEGKDDYELLYLLSSFFAAGGGGSLTGTLTDVLTETFNSNFDLHSIKRLGTLKSTKEAKEEKGDEYIQETNKRTKMDSKNSPHSSIYQCPLVYSLACHTMNQLRLESSVRDNGTISTKEKEDSIIDRIKNLFTKKTPPREAFREKDRVNARPPYVPHNGPLNLSDKYDYLIPYRMSLLLQNLQPTELESICQLYAKWNPKEKEGILLKKILILFNDFPP